MDLTGFGAASLRIDGIGSFVYQVVVKGVLEMARFDPFVETGHIGIVVAEEELGPTLGIPVVISEFPMPHAGGTQLGGIDLGALRTVAPAPGVAKPELGQKQ